MDLPLRLAVLAAALLLVLVVALVRRRTDGVAAAVVDGALVTPADLGGPLGRAATLLQVSTQFCSPCRAARSVLEPLARSLPDVEHVEVRAEDDVDLVRRLGVTRTPTLLVLDGAGRVVGRAVGVPTRAHVLEVLAPLVPAARAS